VTSIHAQGARSKARPDRSEAGRARKGASAAIGR